MEIKVLWLDDEFDTVALKSTFMRMEKYFTLIRCYTKEEFLAKIDSEDWDAIVLDVLDKNGRDSGFRAAVMRIMTKFKDVPWFVFSGQTDVIKKESDIRSMLEEEDCQRDYADIIYVKSNDNDKLIEDIKNAVCNKVEWQTRNRYNDVLRTQSVNTTDLLRILVSIESGETNNSSRLNEIRKLLEDFAEYIKVVGLTNDKFSFKDISSHLGLRGNQDTLVPSYIQRSMHSCIEISNNGSHRLKSDEDIKNNISPYLIRSTTFELLNVILWIENIIKTPDLYIELKCYLQSINGAPEGIIEQDTDGNYHCGRYLLKYNDILVTDIGKRIRVTKKSQNANERTKYLYEYFAHQFEKIEE